MGTTESLWSEAARALVTATLPIIAALSFNEPNRFAQSGIVRTRLRRLFCYLAHELREACCQRRNPLNGCYPSPGVCAGGNRLTKRLKTLPDFSAKSWCSARGTTLVLSSITTEKPLSAKRCNQHHPVSLTTVRGIIGITG